MKALLIFLQTIYDRYADYLLALFFSIISLLFYVNQENSSVHSMRVIGLQLVSSVQFLGRIVVDYVSLQEENEKIKEKSRSLLVELQSLHSLKMLVENNSDIAMLYHSQKLKRHDIKVAKAVHRKYDESYNFITINLGARDSIMAGMGAFSEKGLVGRVLWVGPNYAVVQPVINKDFRMAVITEITKNDGIIEWDGGSTNIASLKYIPTQVSLSLGEKIYTSDLGSFSESGIEVGKIIDIKQGRDDFFFDVSVQLSVDFSSINYLFVSMSNKYKEVLSYESVYSLLK